jgi:phospholipid/cholesterol/gamma-HCH transport system substrate-binding protein
VAISSALRTAVEAYSDPKMARDVQRSLASVRALLEEVEKGEGVLHALIYDKQAGQQVRTLMANMSGAAARMDAALAEVDALLGQVRTGDGMAHSLLYEPGGKKAMEELGAAAGELAGLLADAKKNPNGAVHQLVYGDSGNMFADLGSAAADVKKITSTIAKGDGTVGGLIADPTIYEDLRTVLGNVKRNRVLRALVRFTVNNHEELEQIGKPQENPPPMGEGRGGSGTTAEPPKPEAPKPQEPVPPAPPPPPQGNESKLDQVPPP